MRLVIIEDSAPVQTMLVDALSTLPYVDICGIADASGHAIDLVRLHQPEIAILDLFLKDGSSIPHIRSLLSARPGLVIIVFSLNIDPILCGKVLQIGAAHCFDKSLGADPVVDAVKTLATGLLQK